MGNAGKQDCLNKYEICRNERIAQNNSRLEALGILSIAKSMTSNQNSQRKEKNKAGVSNTEDMDCIPNFHSKSVEKDSVNFEVPRKVTITRSGRHLNYIPPRSLMKYSNNAKQGIGLNNEDRYNKIQQGAQLEQLSDKQHTQAKVQEPSSSFQKKANAKGLTMAEMIMLKQLEKEKVANHRSDPLFTCIAKDVSKSSKKAGGHVNTRPISEVACEQLDSNQVQAHRESLSRLDKDGDHLASDSEEDESFDILFNNNENNDDFHLNGFTDEEGTEEVPTGNDIEQLKLNTEDIHLHAISNGNKRGPTMLHYVHTRPLLKRKPIILNEFGQPIGPVVNGKNMVAELSRFLGTMARDHSYAPLVYDSWWKVPNKEKMWEYVLTKYIVPEEGKEWVIKTIGTAWRIYKCRFKRTHYSKYNDDKTRWENRSKRVPDEDFIKLLSKWKKRDVQLRCARNRECRLSQKNMHTAGPKSFTVIREELRNEHPDKELPTLAKMFESTRKRKEGNKYKDSYDDTGKKIEDMKNYIAPEDGPIDPFLGVMGKDYSDRCRLYGKGVCSKKMKVDGAAMSYVVPEEIMESLKENLLENMRKDMDCEITNKVQDMYKEKEEEHLKKKAELENMQRDLEEQRDNLTEHIMRKILAKLPLDVARKYLS